MESIPISFPVRFFQPKGCQPASGAIMRSQFFVSCCFAFAVFSASAQTPVSIAIPPDNSYLTWVGRYDSRDMVHPRLAYPGTGVQFRFRGTGANLRIASTTATSALTVVIDHGEPQLRVLKQGENDVELLTTADPGPHTVEVYKRTETWQGIVTIEGVDLAPASELVPSEPLPVRKLIFIGDSVTCGANIDLNATCTQAPQLPANNAYASYGMLLARRLDAQTQLVCYGGRGLERDYRGLTIADNVVNAPDFLSLAIASDEPTGRVSWDSARYQPDAIFISLGTNDFNLEAKKPLDEKKWVAEYVAFLHQVRTSYPRALIFVTEGAIVINPLLRQMVQRAAAVSLDSHVIYTPSQHYPGNGCDGHPTRVQHAHMADDFEPVFRRALGW